MEHMDLYRDIAERTNGDIYLGLVGPVRTGKSTFIKRFMEQMVLPGMENAFARERAQDEMPQSGAGKTIMTTQPHFVPNEAVELTIGEDLNVRIRLVDCVGYIVKGVIGTTEDGEPRMVRTPWADYDIPFEEAAELGTKKVITDHATIGIVMTTDGTITDIPRLNYVDAEERVIAEVKAQNKPFIVVLNSTTPQAEETENLRQSLEIKYGVPVRALDVLNMTQDEIDDLLADILMEFPITQLSIDMPRWIQVLPASHALPAGILKAVGEAGVDIRKMRDYKKLAESFNAEDGPLQLALSDVDMGAGSVVYKLTADPAMFYQVLSQECGYEIDGDYELMALMKELMVAKREYDRLAGALASVQEVGYGFVPPSVAEMTLEEPEMIRQGGRFGVRLKASAPSLHLMRVDIQTEVSPIMGTEKQSEELANYLLAEFENDPAQIWETNIFGKSLHDLVQEGLSNKLARMPDDAQHKMAETMQRIINEGHGGLICILL
nr:stage IV sporulation protein A [Maliibacterium massiliense]